jgi:hypothetical protein
MELASGESQAYEEGYREVEELMEKIGKRG